MRNLVASAAVGLALIAAAPASALENHEIENLGPGTAAPAPPPPETRAEQLDKYFGTLKTTKDTAAAQAAENAIVTLWMESGSDTVDLLMASSLKAIQDKDYADALDILDRVVMMAPDYPEGWNKRATVYYLTDEYAKAVADIKRVLVLEPRHFGALTGLGSIFRELGQEKQALEAYGEALALDPYLDSVRKAMNELAKENGEKDI
jgi:tetratricopeptide (TPR) repeat protein